MGSISSSTLWDRLFVGSQECRLVIWGIEAAGATTILYKLKLGEVVKTNQTIGFNVEQVDYHNIHFTIWDVGGNYKQLYFRHYCQGVERLIFVVDSNDIDPVRVETAKNELKMLLVELQEVTSVLIFANKQDLPQAMSTSTLTEQLELPHLFQHCNRHIEWHIQPCSAVNGEGLYEGLDWLSKSMLK